MSSEPEGPPAGDVDAPAADTNVDAAAADEPGVVPRRLHPAGIAVLGVRSLRELALPLGVAFATAVLGGGGGQPLARVLIFGVLGALLAAAAGLVGWLTTRWSVGDGRIRLRTGLVSEKVTDVPLGRVQAIDTVHGPLQRLFGVRGVHVQTAGGGRAAEITLPAVTPADIDLLRAAMRRRGAALDGPPAAVEHRLSRGQLLVAALTAGQIGVILPLLAIVPQLGEELWGGDLERAGEEGLRLVPETPAEWALGALALLALAWLLSAAGAVVAFAGFAIARDGERLRIRRGLLARRDATVPVARVQAIHVVEGLLRQPFGLVALRVEVAGYAKEQAAAQTLFPLLRRAAVQPFLAGLVPELADPPGRLEPAPRRALSRYVLPLVAAAAVAGAAASVAAPGVAPWPLLVVAPAALYGVSRWRAAGWRLAGGRLALRFRRLARITVLAPAARLQEHGTRQTVLQRRARLADVEVRVGAGTRGLVRHLDEGVAGALFDALRRDRGG